MIAVRTMLDTAGDAKSPRPSEGAASMTEKVEDPSLEAQGLLQPGLLLELEGGEGLTLMGDINELGGVCNDCSIGNPLVLRYKVLEYPKA